jgi:hypothetical protein
VLQIKIYSILLADEVVKRAEPKVVGAEMRNKPWVLYCSARSIPLCEAVYVPGLMVYMT